jgi:hypothetical protein
VIGMPVHLVGSKYLIQNLPPVAGINIAKAATTWRKSKLRVDHLYSARLPTWVSAATRLGLLLPRRCSLPTPVGEIPWAVTGPESGGLSFDLILHR